MPSPLSLFSHSKKSTDIPFQDYYTNWFLHLKEKILPLLQQSLYSSPSSPILISSYLNLLLYHLLSYYDTLDLAATTYPNSLPHLLYPSWRNSLERPFLFLGDLHPYVFTNLLRSFLIEEGNNDNSDEEGMEIDMKSLVLDTRWQGVMAWKDTSKRLMVKIEQIECGLRLMVPALVDRMKKTRATFVGRVGQEWVNCVGKKEKVEVGEAMKVEMEELASVFVDANRLRSNVISEIVGALNVYQGAMFLEGLAQFLVGFKDPDLLHKFKRCKTLISERVHSGV